MACGATGATGGGELFLASTGDGTQELVLKKGRNLTIIYILIVANHVHVDRVVVTSDSDHMSSRILAWVHF